MPPPIIQYTRLPADFIDRYPAALDEKSKAALASEIGVSIGQLALVYTIEATARLAAIT